MDKERRSVSYLGIDTDDFVALLAPIREHALVALDAVRVLVPQHVALPGQRLVALPATEVAAVPILAHRLRVLATENQLERKKKESGQFRNEIRNDCNRISPLGILLVRPDPPIFKKKRKSIRKRLDSFATIFSFLFFFLFGND